MIKTNNYKKNNNGNTAHFLNHMGSIQSCHQKHSHSINAAMIVLKRKQIVN